MELSASYFHGIKDNNPKRLDFKDWDNFVLFLKSLTLREFESKSDAELISPAIFNPGDKRRNVNVICWAGWAAVDVDEHDYNDIENDIKSELGDLEYVIYSTASSTVDNPKFRIVFRIDKVIPQEKIRHFWFALQTKLSDGGDVQCKDFSRMYYIPGNYKNAWNFFYHNKGNPLNVEKLLEEFPYSEKQNSSHFLDRLPQDIQRYVVAHRKNQMENKIEWSGYRDCPFWPKKLAEEYQTINGTGWYHKMYQIMVACAGNAIYREYPITSEEIAELCREFDRENGNWYENRPINVEADRAIEYAYRK